MGKGRESASTKLRRGRAVFYRWRAGVGRDKSGQRGTNPKRVEYEDAKPEGVSEWRRRVGGRGRQDGGAMGAVSGPPLTVSNNTL
jgi:hypothetical protein